MRKYLPSIILGILLVSLQTKIWLGKGSLPYVEDQEKELAQIHERIEQEKQKSIKLEAEIADLKDGLTAVEGKARQELGMIKNNEIFVQIERVP